MPDGQLTGNKFYWLATERHVCGVWTTCLEWPSWNHAAFQAIPHSSSANHNTSRNCRQTLNVLPGTRKKRDQMRLLWQFRLLRFRSGPVCSQKVHLTRSKEGNVGIGQVGNCCQVYVKRQRENWSPFRYNLRKAGSPTAPNCTISRSNTDGGDKAVRCRRCCSASWGANERRVCPHNYGQCIAALEYQIH